MLKNAVANVTNILGMKREHIACVVYLRNDFHFLEVHGGMN